MGSASAELPIVPSARLQIVIHADGSIGVLQHRDAPPRKLDVQEVAMIAAFSTGKITNMNEGLAAYLESTGLSEHESGRLTKFANRLLRQDRLEQVSTAEESYQSNTRSPDSAAIEAEIPEGSLTLKTPCTFRLCDGGFQAITHAGTSLPIISATELHCLSQLVNHKNPKDAVEAHREVLGAAALNITQFLELLPPFVANRYIIKFVERTELTSAQLSEAVFSGGSSEMARHKLRMNANAQKEAEELREKATGQSRPKVIPVSFDEMAVPAGLGAVIAYSKVHEEGALDEFYNFRTDWIWDPEAAEAFAAQPAIYLFSNYLWTHKECIQVSEQIKKRSPNSITIHGGPDTPKYEGDEQRYFADHPHVDVTVRGEGELTCAEVLSALRQVIGQEQPELSVLDGVEGCTYRGANSVVRNPDRDRVTDLNMLPSAYLMGLFDMYIGIDDLYVILETNRGCPYGCTFCDWGSATASKIRRFDEERVMAEIEWTAKAKAASVSIADANFGIFPRDVDFARKAAQLKNATGYPRGFGGNYAKNTVKYLRNIIDVLAEGNILTLGTLSLQSMDEETLDSIHRSNIKTEKYDSLAVEMRRAHLPLTIELMMGLPGSTVASFREDLQQCIDRELPARVNMTTLLVNSPMNDPDYLKEFEIETSVPIAPGNLAMLASTSTYSKNDLTTMVNLRGIYLLFENYGVMRVVSRFVRQETSLDEMGFYEKLMFDTLDHSRWPMLHLLCHFVPSLMAPPCSWSLITEELGRYLVAELGISDSPALRTVLAAQLACLPAHDRAFPEKVELECDVVAWHLAIIHEKEEGNRRGWTQAVPRLETFQSGSLTVGDPHGVSATSLGINREFNAFGINWELESPLHRARADLQ